MHEVLPQGRGRPRPRILDMEISKQAEDEPSPPLSCIRADREHCLLARWGYHRIAVEEGSRAASAPGLRVRKRSCRVRAVEAPKPSLAPLYPPLLGRRSRDAIFLL